MAQSSSYLSYLDNEYTIAPVNSQEEVQAAHSIAEVFKSHGLEPTTQDFEAYSGGDRASAVLYCLLFIGVVFSGVDVMPLAAFGLAASLVAAVILILRFFGNNLLGSFGSLSKSQNVIAFHEATGELADKSNRPIVIVAHYDTPRENFLYNPPFATVTRLCWRACVVCVPVAALMAILQVLPFVPLVAQRVLWVVGIVAAVPVALCGASTVASRFMGCTPGANNNKSGVATMLSIMDDVRPLQGGQTPTGGEDEAAPADALSGSGSADDTMAMSAARKRHGKEVLERLGILPADCVITYQEAPALSVVAGTDVAAQTADEDATVQMDALPEEGAEVPVEEDASESDATTPMELGEISEEAEASAAPAEDADAETDDGADDAAADEEAEPAAAQEEVATADETILIPKGPARDGSDADTSDDGRTRRFGPAQRALLFDLPNPAENEVDPLDNTDGIDTTSDLDSLVEEPFEGDYVRQEGAAVAPLQEPLDRISTPAEATPDPSTSTKHKRKALFRRRKHDREAADSMSSWLGVEGDYDAKKDGREIGDWDHFDDDDDPWKGGAAINDQLRLVDGNPNLGDEVADSTWESEGDPAAAPSESELRRAVFSLGDDRLISHDIWFVALGGSALNHAGMKAFLDDYRTQLRGAFLINLDCLGSGQLTVYEQEGLSARRKADKRIVRLLRDTASDMHIDLATADMNWGDTDATPAMRTSLRSATITALDETGLPPRARSLTDTIDGVDASQLERVSDLVCEAIRRS